MNQFELTEKSRKLKAEVREKALGYILTALGLVAGLAWNEAIQSLINSIFPADKNSILAQLIYAVVITLVVVVVATYLTRYIHKEDK